MDKKEFKNRRKRLMDMIGSDSIAILPTASVITRNRDVEFPFRPDSDFFYLTGYPEPEAVLVLIPDRKEGESILFVVNAMKKWKLGMDGVLVWMVRLIFIQWMMLFQLKIWMIFCLD